MAPRTTRSRAAALRAARDARAQQIADRVARERAIETALADYYEGASAAEEIRNDARTRAERIIDAAEERAAGADALAAKAVRALRDLGQTNAEIAEQCGISVGTVRVLANENEEAPDTTRARGSSEEEAAPPPEARSDASMANETAG